MDSLRLGVRLGVRLGTGNEFGSLITMKIQILFSYTETNKIKPIKNNHKKIGKKKKRKGRNRLDFHNPKEKKKALGVRERKSRERL